MTAGTAAVPQQELDYRANDGVEVALLWDRTTDCLAVSVYDGRTGEAFELAVESHEALDAFRHPYAYAAFRGIDYQTPLRAPAEAVYA